MQNLLLTANILFSGIGCQERGIENSGIFNLKVLTVSEIDEKAAVAYAAIHKGLTPEMIRNYEGYPALEEMERELTEKNIGFCPKTGNPPDWSQKKKGHDDNVKKNWLANHLIHNAGDITRIHALPQADLWTVSFPCQDISSAGKGKGLKDGSGTRSSLLWESIRLLKRSLDDGTSPKFMLFENVKRFTSKKFMPDFQKLLDTLSGLGYRTSWQILNACDCGIPQNRERVFIVCIREDITAGEFTFPKPMEQCSTVDGIFRPDEKEGIPLNEEKAAAIAGMLEYTGIQQDAGYPEGTARNTGYKAKEIVSWDPGEKKKHPKYSISKLTPEMCFQLTGLDEEDVRKCRAVGITDTTLCRQAGNGIVTNCIQLLTEHLYKCMDPSFVCSDEKNLPYRIM